MPAKRKPFVVYQDDTTHQQLEVIRQHYEKKVEGTLVKVNDGYIGRELIREKYNTIMNGNTRSATMEYLRMEMSQLTKQLTTVEDELAHIKLMLRQLLTTQEGDKYDHAD